MATDRAIEQTSDRSRDSVTLYDITLWLMKRATSATKHGLKSMERFVMAMEYVQWAMDCALKNGAAVAKCPRLQRAQIDEHDEVPKRQLAITHHIESAFLKKRNIAELL